MALDNKSIGGPLSAVIIDADAIAADNRPIDCRLQLDGLRGEFDPIDDVVQKPTVGDHDVHEWRRAYATLLRLDDDATAGKVIDGAVDDVERPAVACTTGQGRAEVDAVVADAATQQRQSAQGDIGCRRGVDRSSRAGGAG